LNEEETGGVPVFCFDDPLWEQGVPAEKSYAG
jgi:hypothetical protein